MKTILNTISRCNEVGNSFRTSETNRQSVDLAPNQFEPLASGGTIRTACASWHPVAPNRRTCPPLNGRHLTQECLRQLHALDESDTDQLRPYGFNLIVSSAFLETSCVSLVSSEIKRCVEPLYGELPIIVSCFGEDLLGDPPPPQGLTLVCLATRDSTPSRLPMGALARRSWAA